MTIGKKLLWGSLGWVLGGPIGAVLGYAFASMDESNTRQSWSQTETFGHQKYPRTKPGDFIVSLLVLFAKVMKADKKQSIFKNVTNDSISFPNFLFDHSISGSKK